MWRSWTNPLVQSESNLAAKEAASKSSLDLMTRFWTMAKRRLDTIAEQNLILKIWSDTSTYLAPCSDYVSIQSWTFFSFAGWSWELLIYSPFPTGLDDNHTITINHTHTHTLKCIHICANCIGYCNVLAAMSNVIWVQVVGEHKYLRDEERKNPRNQAGELSLLYPRMTILKHKYVYTYTHTHHTGITVPIHV